MPAPNTESSRQVALARLRPPAERARSFSGWDLSDHRPHALEPEPPWDFGNLVREFGPASSAVLDLGTGGGEILSALRPSLPNTVVATEEWIVNAPIAFRRLSPLGVHVVRAKSMQLSFADASFDLLLSRHEEFAPGEVARVLAPGGRFVTQQVGRLNWRELRRHFPRMTDFGDLRSECVEAFHRIGFAVESKEHTHRVAYASLGDIVFMLSVAPWEIPDFDLERDLDALLALEMDCGTADGLLVTESRYLIIARKPR